MGAYASMFEPSGDEPIVAEKSQPTKFDWRTSHADATTLSFLETDRLWQRFQQLGANRDGYIEEQIIERPPLSSNTFVKNQLRALLDESNRVPFQNYCLYAQWLQVADEEDKVRATFQLFNNGYAITGELLERILAHVYPSSTKSQLRQWARDTIDEIAGKGAESITEEQWFEFVMSQPQSFREVFNAFRIVPASIYQSRPDVMVKLEVVEPVGSTRTNSQRVSRHAASRARERSAPAADSIPDQKLHDVAILLKKRDWPRLANQLGFLQRDTDSIKRRYKDPHDQVYQMLAQWKKQQSKNAKLSDLKNALKNVGLGDVAAQI